MKALFADTSFYIAVGNPCDSFSNLACAIIDKWEGPIITTEYVLIELGNYFCGTNRRLFLRLLAIMHEDPDTTIIPASTELLERGIQLYASRPDKNWSLTDSVSFVVMKQHQIREALTADHHFAQAGFNVLLKK